MRNLFVIILISLSFLLLAQLPMPHVFSDHMVLPRNIDIPIWGKADPGSELRVVLGQQEVKTHVNMHEEWSVHIPQFEAEGPYELKIYFGKDKKPTLSYTDVLIGDVWLAPGQSNMEWQVKQLNGADKEILNAHNPNIRYYKVPHDKSLEPLSDTKNSTWLICDSNTVKEFSAVGYYFAKKLEADINVPIGIIQSTWEGTPVEAWTRKKMLLSEPLAKSRAIARHPNWATFHKR